MEVFRVNGKRSLSTFINNAGRSNGSYSQSSLYSNWIPVISTV